MGIDPLAIAGEQRQLLLNRLLLVEAGLARVEQRFAPDSPLEGDGFEFSVPRRKRTGGALREGPVRWLRWVAGP
jgi:hypothetical protein